MPEINRKIQVNNDGALDILDKTSMITYRGLGVFEDGSDAGDTYNYSPALHDSILFSSSCKAEIAIIEKGPIICTIRIKINLSLPEYEVKGNSNTIALTLFRSVGWLARGDLLTRTGDAGKSASNLTKRGSRNEHTTTL